MSSFPRPGRTMSRTRAPKPLITTACSRAAPRRAIRRPAPRHPPGRTAPAGQSRPAPARLRAAAPRRHRAAAPARPPAPAGPRLSPRQFRQALAHLQVLPQSRALQPTRASEIIAIRSIRTMLTAASRSRSQCSPTQSITSACTCTIAA